MNFVLQDENAANIMSTGKPTLIQRKPLVEKQNNSSPAPAEKAVPIETPEAHAINYLY